MKLRRVALPEINLPELGGPFRGRRLLVEKELLPEQELQGTEWPPLNPKDFKLIFKVKDKKE